MFVVAVKTLLNNSSIHIFEELDFRTFIVRDTDGVRVIYRGIPRIIQMAAIERPRNNSHQKAPAPRIKPKPKRCPNPVPPTSGTGSPSGGGERRHRPLPSLHGPATDSNVPRPRRPPKSVPHQKDENIEHRQYLGGNSGSGRNISPSGRSSSSSNSSEPPEIPQRRYLFEDVESNVPRRAFLDEDEQVPVVPSRGYLEEPVVPPRGYLEEPVVPPRGYLEEEPVVPPRGYLEEEPVVPPRGYLEEPVVPTKGYPEMDENFIEKRAPMPLPSPKIHDIANERMSPLLARQKLDRVSVKNYPLPSIPIPQHSTSDTPLMDSYNHNYEEMEMDQWAGYDDEDEAHSYEMIEGEEWFPDGKPLIPPLLSPHDSPQVSRLPRKLEESPLIHDKTPAGDKDDGYVDVDADDDEYVDVNEDDDNEYVDINEDDDDDKYDYEFMQLDGGYEKDSRIEDKLLDDRKEDKAADLKKERYVHFKESMNQKPSIPPPPQSSYPQSSVPPKGSNSLRKGKLAIRPKYDKQASSDVGYYNVQRADSQLQTPAEGSYYNVQMADSVEGEVHTPSAPVNDGYYNVEKVIPEGQTSHAPKDCGYYNIERVESHR